MVPSNPNRRIAVDLSPLTQTLTGIGIYTQHLIRALLRTHGEADLVYPMLSLRRKNLEQTVRLIRTLLPENEIPVAYRRFPGRVGRHFPLRWFFPELSLVHITTPSTLYRPAGLPTVVTAHDIAWLRLDRSLCPMPPHPGLAAYPRLLRQADAVLAVSENTRRDLIEILGIPAERITVTPLAPRPEFHPPAKEQRERLDALRQKVGGPFFVHVGTIDPRKNVPRLLRAFGLFKQRGYRQRLVFLGHKGWGWPEAREALASLDLAGEVTFLDYVSDADMMAYLWAAEALVMVSLYEGFGLPVLEAMAAGTPVIASRAGSLPEVAGEAAVLVDPLSIEAIAMALERLCSERLLGAELREAGPRRAREFSWTETAERTWRTYQRVLAQ